MGQDGERIPINLPDVCPVCTATCNRCQGKHAVDPNRIYYDRQRVPVVQAGERLQNEGEPVTVLVMCPCKQQEFEVDMIF